MLLASKRAYFYLAGSFLDCGRHRDQLYVEFSVIELEFTQILECCHFRKINVKYLKC